MSKTHNYNTVSFHFLDGTIKTHPNTVDFEGSIEYGINWRVNLEDMIIFLSPSYYQNDCFFEQRID